MTERENILGRVREALERKAPLPGHDGCGASTKGIRELLPASGDSFEERVAKFQANAALLKASFQLVNRPDELTDVLRVLRDTEGWKRVGTHDGALTSPAVAALGLPVVKTNGGYDVRELDQCDAGITECDALVAQTGGVLVTSRSAGGRALSVLPPHHVVLARREQLLRDLPEAFELLQRKYGGDYPSMISFVTGPSRTADIERIIVLGAHGPKKLTVLLLN